MKVMAITRFEYAAKLRLPGDEFDTDNDEHAQVLVLAQRVKIVATQQTEETRDLRPDEIRKPNPYRDKYRNRYRHRAITADE